MRTLFPLSLAPAVNNWLADSCHPRILHVFDRACNLINEHRDVLSIVTPEIGNGPFNLVVDSDGSFFRGIQLEDSICATANQLTVGDVVVNTIDVELWNPRPDWETLHAKRDDITKELNTACRECGLDMSLAKIARDYSTTTSLQSLIPNLSLALANKEIPSIQKTASELAGLGPGLTPSGDDILLGAVYAAWIIHPREVAESLGREIADTAAPLTTSLSAAWLRSAGRGEAGGLWHGFFDALVFAESARIHEAMDRILAVGESSGADAIAGFVNTLMCWMDKAAS